MEIKNLRKTFNMYTHTPIILLCYLAFKSIKICISVGVSLIRFVLSETQKRS